MFYSFKVVYVDYRSYILSKTNLSDHKVCNLHDHFVPSRLVLSLMERTPSIARDKFIDEIYISIS